MLQEMVDRVKDIGESEISGLKVALFPPATIDSRLPLLLPLEGAVPYSKRSQTEFTAVVVWDFWLYIAKIGSDLESVNNINLREYLDQFATVWLSRDLLQYAASGNAVALPYVLDTSFELVSGLSRPKPYPPNSSSQNLFWGCQYRLTVSYHNIITRAI